MIKQQIVSATGGLRRNPLLAVMIGLLCAFLSYQVLFVSDPGDSGSGIGGTGRFGGESGVGGTGAPNPGLGALDNDNDAESDGDSFYQTTPAMIADRAREPASEVVPVDVDSLRLSPDAEELAALKGRLEAVQRELDRSLQRVADQSDLARADLAAIADHQAATVVFDPEDQLLSRDMRADMLIDSMEITRQLMLAETNSSLMVDLQPDAVFSYDQDENVGEAESTDVFTDDTRRRLSVPARPERPDRPSMPRRSAPSQRAIPTPPVRPLRI